MPKISIKTWKNKPSSLPHLLNTLCTIRHSNLKKGSLNIKVCFFHLVVANLERIYLWKQKRFIEYKSLFFHLVVANLERIYLWKQCRMVVSS